MSLGAGIARGASWMLLMRLIDRTVALVSTMILARVLTPDIFGLVALAMTIVGVVEVFGSFGFDTTLIQSRTQSREAFDTAWTFGLLYGLASAVVIVAMSMPVAGFFDDARLGPILLVLAVAPALTALENIGTVKFRMELDFRREFLLLASKRIPGILVTIPLAITMRTVWALVAGIVLGRLWGLCMSYIMSPFRPRFSFAARASLGASSAWLLANNVFGFIGSRLADMVLGRVGGTQDVGLFNASQDIAFLPSNDLLAPVNRAVFPGYAAIAADEQRMGASFLTVTGVQLLIAVPACVGISITAPLLVAVLLGPQWTAAIPIIALLALSGIAMAIGANATYVLLALGAMRTVAFQSGLRTAVLTVLIIPLTLNFGLMGAAWATAITALQTCLSVLALVATRLRITVGSIAGLLWRPAIGALVMWAGLRSIIERLGVPGGLLGSAANLAILIAVGAMLYTAAVLVLWRCVGAPAGGEREIWIRAREFLKNIRS